MLTSFSRSWCTVLDMQMKADTGHVLMSEALRGNVPSLEGEALPQAIDQHVIVIIDRIVGGVSTPLVGVLRGVLLGAEPELELRCELKEAIDLLEASGLSIGRFELHHGQRVLSVPGPFSVKAARLDEIVPEDQLCALGLHMTRQTR